MSEVTELSDESFDGFVKENDVALVDFWAPWCGPCMMLAPTVKKLAQEYSGKVSFAKLNIDDNKEAAGKFNVMSIPTLIVFKGGQAAETIIGAVPGDRIKEKLDALL
ncbi:MAG: thioredoxin [Methanobacteriota archaeon]